MENSLKNGLFTNDLITWLYNFIFYDQVDFLYKFHGGRYHNMVLEKKELEKSCHITIEHPNRDDFFNYKNIVKNQPCIIGYLSPFISHMDDGLIFFNYETKNYRMNLK